MSEVAFYHLQRSPLEEVLPKLLERTLSEGERAVVIAGSQERVEALAGHLWTYRPEAWLPHGTAQDGAPEDQPVWLTDHDENPNGAGFLFLTDGADSERLADYRRCFDLFDGNDPAAAESARQRWRSRLAAGHTVTYWRQGERGWERQG